MSKEFRGLMPYPFGRRHLARVFEDFLNEDWGSILPVPFGSRDVRVDIRETDTDIVLEAELPGMKKEDIEITLDESHLTLRANTSAETEEKRENFIRKERRSGSLVRSFLLPAEVREEEVKARFENGLLELRLPKKEPGRASKRKIDIE
ncbi:MAG: Hsp20/alpha crystallin family protein [Firmicutes bacterium]|nr:Hsp20/alpha crystallin family protein [Bacillota bacterium]